MSVAAGEERIVTTNTEVQVDHVTHEERRSAEVARNERGRDLLASDRSVLLGDDESELQGEAVPDEQGGADEIDAAHRPKAARIFVFGVLPGLAIVLALVVALLKWQDGSMRDARVGSVESVEAAKENTIAILSYRPETVEKDLQAARDRLTGTFKDSYTSLIHDVVIPGAKQKRIAAVAKVPAAASLSADSRRAVVLVFVDQTTTVGADAPTDTASSVRVTLENVSGHWLISQFDPI